MGLAEWLKDKFSGNGQNIGDAEIEEIRNERRRDIIYNIRPVKSQEPKFYRATYELTTVKDREVFKVNFPSETYVDIDLSDGGVDVREVDHLYFSLKQGEKLRQFEDKREEGVLHLPTHLVHDYVQKKYETHLANNKSKK